MCSPEMLPKRENTQDALSKKTAAAAAPAHRNVGQRDLQRGRRRVGDRRHVCQLVAAAAQKGGQGALRHSNTAPRTGRSRGQKADTSLCQPQFLRPPADSQRDACCRVPPTAAGKDTQLPAPCLHL